MHETVSLVLFAILIASIESVGMTTLTYYSKSFQIHNLILGILIYGLCIPFLVVKSLSYAGIGTVNLLWNIISTVSMIVIGYYFFNEKVNHLHLFSLFFGVAAIVLLYFAQLQE